MLPQLLALITAFSYATANVSARRGLEQSTPLAAMVMTLALHTSITWLALFLTHGIPRVAPAAALAIAIVGVLISNIPICTSFSQ